MAGTRPAGPIAAGWAILHHLGTDGYLRLAEDTHVAAAMIRSTIVETPGLALRGSPDATVFAFGGEPGRGGVDSFALGDALADRGGWFFDRQTPPDSLHATVHAGHRAVAAELCADLVTVTGELLGSGDRAADRTARYGTG
jgi:glutamate/tyrosine decarboxylase-like PLP-dependent enzyme